MSTVTLIQAQPRFAASGAVADIRLAGGGTQAYFQLGFGDWRSGIARPPRFSTAIGFDQRGLTGGALPSTGGFEFSSSDKALFSALGGMVWEGALVTVTTGDDEDIFPDYVAQLVGTVAAVKTDKATLSFVIADLSIDLDKPVIVGTFSGSGALEGGDDAVGRPKRRSWGPVFGIEGRLLDKAYNVYEFGDPAYPLRAFKALKDKGRTGDMIVVPWQGSGLATLNALRAANPPSGGGAVAPSIACAKWWTTPAGPLTADLEGEVGAGYVSSAVAIAARIALTYSAAIRIDEASRATAETWPAGAAPAGVHCAETSESVANLLDRLLLPVSIIWILDGAGRMTFRRLTWESPVEVLRADTIKRETTFKPLKTRRLGYQRNHRPHGETEISAAIPADEILFPDGSTAADLADIVAEQGREIDAVVSDSVLSRPEKTIEGSRYDSLIAQQTALDAKYVALGSPPELNDAKNAATAFINALTFYLNGLSPSWRDTGTDTAIVKDDYAGYWRNALAAIAQYIAAITGRAGRDGNDGTDGDDGANGTDGFSLIASPPAFVVPSFSNGTSKPAWQGGSCRIALIKGGVEIAADAYSYAAVSNIASIAMSGQSVTFADVIGDKGEFTARATRAGINYDLRVTVVRTKDGSSAFVSTGTISGDATGTGGGNTTAPGGKTATISASATYGPPANSSAKGSMSFYWRNVTDNGPLQLLGTVEGSVTSNTNVGSQNDPEYETIYGSVSGSFSFTTPTPDKQIEYSVGVGPVYGRISGINGSVRFEVMS